MSDCLCITLRDIFKIGLRGSLPKGERAEEEHWRCSRNYLEGSQVHKSVFADIVTKHYLIWGPSVLLEIQGQQKWTVSFTELGEVFYSLAPTVAARTTCSLCDLPSPQVWKLILVILVKFQWNDGMHFFLLCTPNWNLSILLVT